MQNLISAFLLTAMHEIKQRVRERELQLVQGGLDKSDKFFVNPYSQKDVYIRLSMTNFQQFLSLLQLLKGRTKLSRLYIKFYVKQFIFLVSKYTDNCLNFFEKFLKGVLLLRVRMNFEMLSNMKTLIRFSDLYG